MKAQLAYLFCAASIAMPAQATSIHCNFNELCSSGAASICGPNSYSASVFGIEKRRPVLRSLDEDIKITKKSRPDANSWRYHGRTAAGGTETLTYNRAGFGSLVQKFTVDGERRILTRRGNCGVE